jgi:uncharacterized protein
MGAIVPGKVMSVLRTFTTKLSSIMSLMQAIDPLHSISGFGVGVLIGMTGVGGGSLMTPLLILLFGIHPATAVGTDLLYSSATKMCGTLVHGLTRTVDWRVVGRLASGSVPSTALTLTALSYLDMKEAAADQLIKAVLGVALFSTAAALFFPRRNIEAFAIRAEALGKARTAIWTSVAGAALGVMVSISSIGAGALGAAVLVLLYPKLAMARIVGSDIAHAVPLTLIAGLGHWILGSVDWTLLRSLLVGSLPGVFLGGYLSTRVSGTCLRFLMVTMLLAVGCKLLF